MSETVDVAVALHREAGIGTRRMEAAKEQVVAGLAKHGSSANWPTLTLTPDQFPTCICGLARTDHRAVGEECLTTECVDNPDGCGWFVAKMASRDVKMGDK